MRAERLEFAIQVAREAARRVRKLDTHRDDIKVSYKAPGDPVTNADLLAERIIMEGIADRFPQDGILSEESGASGDQDSCWVLDPIDGTSNFVQGLPLFAISLAWCEGGKPVLGVIHDIMRDVIYTTQEGKGSFRDGRRIKVASETKLSGALLGSTGSMGLRDWRAGLLAEANLKSAGLRRIGSGTLDFAYVAQGALHACFGARMQYWDYAVGGLLVREAGGVFTDLDGNEEVEFGSRLGFCVYGSPRIVGALRRMALRHRDS